MELEQRRGEDRFLSPDRYRQLERDLRGNRGLGEVRSLVISAFDRRTRMLPFVHFDWYMVPAGPRAIGAALASAGMGRTRVSFGLHNPNLDPARAEVDGQPIDMLLISAVKVHAAAAYRLIERAWSKGADRPLIIAGGPKVCYEPFDMFGLGADGQIGVDVAVTGEEPVLLELLSVLGEYGAGAGTMRQAFERARRDGALEKVSGLVYSRDGRSDGRHLINTGPQRLLADLDVLPMPTVGFGLLEPAHRRATLAAQPIPLADACRGLHVAAVLVTRGCKFNCHYCPIPSYNMRTFRRKSAERIVEELADCRVRMDTRYFFGADDNFFNSRRYVEEVIERMATRQIDGKPMGRRLRFATEATVIDVYKNRDLLPLARPNRAGFNGIWMGVEDLSGTLIDKGQQAEVTRQVCQDLLANNISPMAMLMHHDRQPLFGRRNLEGLIDQVRFLHEAGVVGIQCTVASPAVGTRLFNDCIEQQRLFESVAGLTMTDRHSDGNHVFAAGHRSPWRQQLNVLLAYGAFYNPVNLVRILNIRQRLFQRKHLGDQIWGMAALAETAWRLKGHLWRLWRGPIRYVADWPERFTRAGSPYPAIRRGDSPPDPETFSPFKADIGESSPRRPVASRQDVRS